MNPNSQPPIQQQFPNDPYDDEISLWEIFETLQKRWKTVALLALGCPLIALAVSLAWPKQYEASALIQLAKIGNLQAAIDGKGALTSPVESSATTIQRIQSEGFQARIAKELATPVMLKASEPKGTGLIEIKARTESLASAEAAVTASIRALKELHSDQAKGSVQSLEQSLLATKAESETTSALLRDLLAKTSQISKLDPIIAVSLGQLQGQLITQQSALSERQPRLELALSSINTGPTQAIESISSSPAPVVPKTKLIVAVAFLGGGFLGVLIALMAQAWRNRKDASSKTA